MADAAHSTSVSKSHNGHVFDVYAPAYVPNNLKLVNTYPARVVTSKAAPWTDYEQFVQTFAGSSFLQAKQPPSLRTLKPPATIETPLERLNYQSWFDAALVEEIASLQNECENHALYQVPLVQTPYDVEYNFYRLVVPGLRETSLPIEVGDTVHVKQLQFDAVGALVPFSGWQNPQGPVPSYMDVRHDATIWVIDRLKETLFLRIDDFTPKSMMCNVSFTVQSSRLGVLHEAVVLATSYLRNTSWMRSMLFPALDDGILQTSLNPASTGLQPHDEMLNFEQQRAIATVIKGKYGTVPYIVSGPPGTGKTKTVVELALQLLNKDTTSRLLLCAPSDPAADTLTKRLSQYLTPQELLRMNSPSRSFQEVPNNILAYCCVDDRSFGIPPFSQMMRRRLVICTARDAEILLRIRLTNVDMYRFRMEMHEAMNPFDPAFESQLHWQGLVMDEAAQATEPEALLPLLVVAPPVEHEQTGSRAPIVVMVGDQNQLGPRTACKTGALQKSLFERLLARPLYRDHPLSRSRQTQGHIPRLTKDMLPMIRPPFTNLIRNYRSHPAILAIPSCLFYGDTLEPSGTNTDRHVASSLFSNNDLPVRFHENHGQDEIEQDGGGWYNIQEANKAISIAQHVLLEGQLKPHQICIMSPFRAQVKLLRHKARNSTTMGMAAVNIGPLEAFQGLESPLVILCTTRTRDRFIDQDLARGLGVIHEPKRFNVALTRAMHGLIVIGNPDVLDEDQNWAAFLAFCKRNDAWDGECSWQTPHSDKICYSRLEKQFRMRKLIEEDEIANGMRKLGLGTDVDEAAYEAGLAAEQALRATELFDPGADSANQSCFL